MPWAGLHGLVRWGGRLYKPNEGDGWTKPSLRHLSEDLYELRSWRGGRGRSQLLPAAKPEQRQHRSHQHQANQGTMDRGQGEGEQQCWGEQTT